MTSVTPDGEDGVDIPSKKTKVKKRPSDFEIMRTIFTRTTERKLPWILKNMGESEDIHFLCSEEEKGFVFGSATMTIGLLEFTDPELKAISEKFLEGIYGYGHKGQVLINIRDQISELNKTKGVSIDAPVEHDDYGSVWTSKLDVTGKTRTVYYSKGIESLFHFNEVRHWNDQYRFLLATNSNKNLYYDYVHPDGPTHSILTLPPSQDKDHPIVKLYPHGFRAMVTRGIDLIITKQFTNFPYPVEKEELILFLDGDSVCQMAHRVIGQGWRMVLIRPNFVLFPTKEISSDKE